MSGQVVNDHSVKSWFDVSRQLAAQGLEIEVCVEVGEYGALGLEAIDPA